MKKEKGVILVVYKNSRRSRRYAVLQRKKNWEGWELPKGHLEEDDFRKTVRVELKEEAGIPEENIQEVEDMDETVTWEYEQDGEEFRKEYRAFLVEVDDDTTIDTSGNPDDEHVQGFFLGEEDAKSLMTWENNLETLEKAIEKLNQG